MKKGIAKGRLKMMKQKRLVSMIGALVVILGAVVFITGCQQANGGKSGNGDILKKGIIEFDAASVKCQNAKTIPFTDVTSGSPIQEKDKLYFEAILPTGKVVENWYINDVKQEYKTDSKMFYTVKASDIVGNKLKISVVFKQIRRNTMSKNKPIKPADNQANMQNPNKGTSGTNRQYDQNQGNRGEQMNPNKKGK